MMWDLVIEIELAEPAKGKVQFDLLDEPALRADAVTVADDEHPHHELGIDRRPTNLAVVRTGRFLGWLVKEKRVTPHIPVWDRSGRDDGTFSRNDFVYDAEHDVYVCPNGKILRSTGTLHSDNTFRYISKRADCNQCPLKQRCCRKQPERRILRDPNEAARDYARSLAGTPAFEQSSRERKKVEMRFAHLKTHHGFERLRLRGLTGCPRRIPPRCHRPEPQDARAASHQAAARPGRRVSCVVRR